MRSFSINMLPNKEVLLSTATTLALATLLQSTLNFQGFWLLLSALICCQTLPGEPIGRYIERCVMMLMALVWSFSLTVLFQSGVIHFFIYACYFIGLSYYLFFDRPWQHRKLVLIIGFSSAWLFAIFQPPHTEQMSIFIFAILLGSFIALMCNIIFVHSNVTKLFAKDMQQYLNLLLEVANAMPSLVQQQKLSPELLDAKHSLEIYIADSKQYPEWIFMQGFNPGLRASFRFFLIQLDTVTELYFVILNQLHAEEIKLPHKYTQALVAVFENNIELLKTLNYYFSQQNFMDMQANITKDIEILTVESQHILSGDIEYFEVAPELLAVVGITRDVKWMRNILLQLNAALPNK